MKGAYMGILTNDMMRVVNEQQLGFVATVYPDGTPNLSPKGTTGVWDDEHLVFADICSPNTVANLLQNPVVEVNVVDTLLCKGIVSGCWWNSSKAFRRGSVARSPMPRVVFRFDTR